MRETWWNSDSGLKPPPNVPRQLRRQKTACIFLGPNSHNVTPTTHVYKPTTQNTVLNDSQRTGKHNMAWTCKINGITVYGGLLVGLDFSNNNGLPLQRCRFFSFTHTLSLMGLDWPIELIADFRQTLHWLTFIPCRLTLTLTTTCLTLNLTLN